MKSIRPLLIPVLWEVLFLIVMQLVPTKTLPVYFIFYLGLILWFVRRNLHADRETESKRISLRDVRGFWLPVLLTTLGMVICYEIKTRVIQEFLFIPDGTINIWMSDSYAGILFYGVTTILAAPIAEELFFRQAVLEAGFGEQRSIPRIVLAVLASFLLCALTHATRWLGILEAILMVLPLTIVYLRTRNVRIPMLVHIAFELYAGFPSVLYVLVRLSLR